MFLAYIQAAKDFNVTITHTFLERGHTKNEGDSVHSLIERFDKNKNGIHTRWLVQYDTVVQTRWKSLSSYRNANGGVYKFQKKKLTGPIGLLTWMVKKYFGHKLENF